MSDQETQRGIMTNYAPNQHMMINYLKLLAGERVEAVMIANMDKYPDEKWKTQTVEEHLTHAVEHIAEYQQGIKTEVQANGSEVGMLDKVACRIAMAIWVSEQGVSA